MLDISALRSDRRTKATRSTGKRRVLGVSDIDPLRDRVERLKARAKGEHALRLANRQFGYTKERYRGLSKKTLQLRTLFALENLWMARRALMNSG
jgi:IS5 family transposase